MIITKKLYPSEANAEYHSGPMVFSMTINHKQRYFRSLVRQKAEKRFAGL